MASSTSVARLCFIVRSKAALQARLWDPCAMFSFARAVLNDGVVLITPTIVCDQPLTWFGAMPLSSSAVSDTRAGFTETALLITMKYVQHSSIPEEISHPEDTNTSVPRSSVSQIVSEIPQFDLDSKMTAILRNLANADFVSALNERFTPSNYYLRKVQQWQDSNRPFIVELHTGIEYFAQIRRDLRIILSIGVQSASDRGCATLHDFVYANKEVNPECLVDRLGFRGNVMDDILRGFLDSTIEQLAGPNMALVHDVSFFSLNGLRYAKVELCRNKKAYMEETGDTSYIRRARPAYETTSVCNKHVLSKAMRTEFDNSHEENIRRLFEGDLVPLSLYMKYDIAKAARVIPHRYAVNRRHYAGILARRELIVPTAKDAKYSEVKPTERIGRVHMDRTVAVGREWLVLFLLVVVSSMVAGGAAYLVSLDSNVNAAEILTTGLGILAGLVITLPQIYVSLHGGGYSLGDFLSWMRAYDLSNA